MTFRNYDINIIGFLSTMMHLDLDFHEWKIYSSINKTDWDKNNRFDAILNILFPHSKYFLGRSIQI